MPRVDLIGNDLVQRVRHRSRAHQVDAMNQKRPLSERGTFIPTTREIAIGRGVVYRPIRSWHSGVLAGEGLVKQQGDSSGCIIVVGDRNLAPQPRTVTHRLYWNVKDVERKRVISAFLSYPYGMTARDDYHWEAYLEHEPEWFMGDNAETEMEARILGELGDPTGDVGANLEAWKAER